MVFRVRGLGFRVGSRLVAASSRPLLKFEYEQQTGSIKLPSRT